MRRGAVYFVAQAVRAACGGVLLFFFLWTAHIVWHLQWDIARYVVALPEWIMSWTATNPRLQVFILVDVLCLVLLSLILATTFVLNRSRGNAFGVLKTVQAGSFVMMLLGLIIATIDPNELWIYMTSFQYQTGFAVWFTNGLDLIVSASLFLVSTMLLVKKNAEILAR